MFTILEVGGFLGIGSRLVAVPYDSPVIDQSGNKIDKVALRPLVTVEDVTLAVVLVVSVLASLAGCGRCSHRGCFERRDRPGCCSSIGVSASCRWYQRFDNRSRLPANAIRSLETTYGGARTDTRSESVHPTMSRRRSKF